MGTLPTRQRAGGFIPFWKYDLIFHEDSGFCTYANKKGGTPPVIFYAIDSTLSEDHHRSD